MSQKLLGILQVGKKIGKYQILKLLGRGGMGAVYLGLHPVLDRQVCLKILLTDSLEHGLASVAQLLQEAKSIAKLEHPNIVKIYDVEQVEQLAFIVMEYIDGKNIAQLLEDRDAFTIRDVLRIGADVAAALQSAHEQHIIHRDVKPQNIMITQKGMTKLTDFGLATFIGDRAKKTAQGLPLLGTPFYLAPECIVGATWSPKSDLYALGITLFHMLAGFPPYTGKTPAQILQQHVKAPLPSLRESRQDVPADLAAVIERLAAKKTAERFGSAAEVAAALRHVQRRLSQEQQHETRPLLADIVQVREEVASQFCPSMATVRVLVVEDSVAISKAICRILEEKHLCQVVGVAHDGQKALEIIEQLKPNVVTLDYNMAIMDGLTTLKNIMVTYPCPVIMLSAFTYEGALTSFECLSCGAVDFIWKAAYTQQKEFKQELVSKVVRAAKMHITMPDKPKLIKFSEPAQPEAMKLAASWLVLMGAGMGGYHSSFKIIPYIPKNIPAAIVLVQEMPNDLLGTFCNYLNRHSRLEVKELSQSEILYAGVCYVINHSQPIRIEKEWDSEILFVIKAEATGPEYSPVVFGDAIASAAQVCGANTVGIVLSGAERNIADGLQELRKAGGTIIVQDPTTCLDDGMAQVALQEGLADKVIPDVHIAPVLWYLIKKKHDNWAATRRLKACKRNCWEIMQCGRETGGSKVQELGACPAAVEKKWHSINGGYNAGRACWLVAGTMCKGDVTGTNAQKIASCTQCEFYKLVQHEENQQE
jgi:chemotaxis response regulator CheB/predicted Ser/Thr protein kinase